WAGRPSNFAAGNDNLGCDQGLKLPDPESPRVAIDDLVGEEFEMAVAEDERLPVLEGDAPPSVDGASRESPRESRPKGQEVLTVRPPTSASGSRDHVRTVRCPETVPESPGKGKTAAAAAQVCSA
ncbi:hypothetical protein THAOC_21874, partial [Thalassiosira oceanica]